jgi:hypothetical protein
MGDWALGRVYMTTSMPDTRPIGHTVVAGRVGHSLGSLADRAVAQAIKAVTNRAARGALPSIKTSLTLGFEIECRAGRIRSGELKSRPADEVFASVEAKLGSL